MRTQGNNQSHSGSLKQDVVFYFFIFQYAWDTKGGHWGRVPCSMVEAPQVQICSHRKWGRAGRHTQHHQNDGQKEKDGCVSMISRLLHCIEKVIIAICGIEKAEKKAQKLRTLSITKQGEWWASGLGIWIVKNTKCWCINMLLMERCNGNYFIFWKSIDMGIEILHGDSLKLLKTVNDKTIDLIITDPPYNINLQPQRGKTEAIANDNMEKWEFLKFLDIYFKECKRVLKDDTFLFSFLWWPTIPEFREICDQYFTLKSMPIWVKNNFGIWYYTRPQYEPCLMYLNGKPPVLENPPSDVWEFARVQKPIHSCEKPVELYEFILARFSNKWDTILDWFAWVWGLWVACKRMWRNCILMEQEEKYCKIIQKRLDTTPIWLFV